MVEDEDGGALAGPGAEDGLDEVGDAFVVVLVDAEQGEGFAVAVEGDEGGVVGLDELGDVVVGFLGVGGFGADVVEVVGVLGGCSEEFEAVDDAGGVVFEVDVDDVVALADLFEAGVEGDPAFAAG